MRTPKQLTYANVASTLALVVALGGGGAAVAAGLAKNSVGSPQLKAGAVKTADLAKNAVDSSKVKKDALTGADIQESTLDLPPGATLVHGAGIDYYDDVIALEDLDTVVGSATITAPVAGRVLVTWSGSFSAQVANNYLDAELVLDGTKAYGTWMDPGDADELFDQQQSLVASVPVTAGAHLFEVTMSEYETAADKYSSVTGGDLTLLFVPEG